MRLPSKALAVQEDMTADCCICYAYRLPSGNPAAPGSDAAGGDSPTPRRGTSCKGFTSVTNACPELSVLLAAIPAFLHSLGLKNTRHSSEAQQRALHGFAGEVPDEACPNARCGRPFHRRCLLEWLLAVSTSRRSFNTVFGVCPYCSQPVTARIV